MNLDGNEGVIATVLTIVAGLAAWVRGERIRNSKADSIISGESVDKAIHDGHKDEFKRLQEAVAKLMPLSQEVEMLKAKLAGIWVYCEMLLLCEECSQANGRIIKKMQEALDPVVKATEPSSRDFAETAKEFLTENYK